MEIGFHNIPESGSDFAYPVKWIESTGGQYIDLGVKATLNTKVVIDWQAMLASGQLFGAYSKSPISVAGMNGIYITLNSIVDGYFLYRYGGSSGMSSYVHRKLICDENWHTTEFGQNKLIIDDEQVSTTSYGYFETDYNLALFAVNCYGTISDRSYFRIKGFKMYEGSELVMDMVPGVSFKGKSGMYDRIGKKMFYSQRDGDFLWEE